MSPTGRCLPPVVVALTEDQPASCETACNGRRTGRATALHRHRRQWGRFDWLRAAQHDPIDIEPGCDPRRGREAMLTLRQRQRGAVAGFDIDGCAVLVAEQREPGMGSFRSLMYNPSGTP